MKKYIHFIILMLLTTALTAQKRVLFSNSNLSIELPEEFKKVDFFDGFYHYPTGTSIQLDAIDSTAYTFMAAGFTQEVLEPQGVTLISKEPFQTASGLSGELITLHFTVTQDTISMDFERLVLLVGDMNRTFIVHINYSLLVKSLIGYAIRESLTTLRIES